MTEGGGGLKTLNFRWRHLWTLPYYIRVSIILLYLSLYYLIIFKSLLSYYIRVSIILLYSIFYYFRVSIIIYFRVTIIFERLFYFRVYCAGNLESNSIPQIHFLNTAVLPHQPPFYRIKIGKRSKLLNLKFRIPHCTIAQLSIDCIWKQWITVKILCNCTRYYCSNLWGSVSHFS